VAPGWSEDVARIHLCAGFLWETIGGTFQGWGGRFIAEETETGVKENNRGFTQSLEQTLTFNQDSFPLARNSLPTEWLEQPVRESRRDAEKREINIWQGVCRRPDSTRL